MEKFEELINERTKAILICNPNNPTGYLYSQKEMNQMLTFQQLFMACDGKSGNLVYLRMVVAEQLRFQL